LSTKIHAAGDALGLPVRMIGGPGQQSDMARAEELVDGQRADYVLGDKGYDSGRLVTKIIAQGAKAVIPSRTCWSKRRNIDKELYKERNKIERFFNRLKQFRRVATRYDKLLINFMGFVKIAAIALWLK
jgi:putative transposase